MVRAACRLVAVAACALTACSSSDDDVAPPATDPPAASTTLERVPAITTAAAPPTSGAVTGSTADEVEGSSAPPLEIVVAAPGTFPPNDAPPPAVGASSRLLGDAPALAYDVSPDGRWTASLRSGEVCLAPIDDPSASACAAPAAGLGPYTRASWSPSGDAVVVMTDRFAEVASGVQVMRTDGSVTDLTAAGSEVELPLDALFVDEGRVLVLAWRRDIRATTLSLFDLPDESATSVGEYTAPEGSPLWVPYATPVSAVGRIVATIARDATGATGEFDIWQFPLDGSQPSVVVESAVRSRGASSSEDLLIPIAVRGNVMLAGFATAREDFEQEARRGLPVFALLPGSGGEPVPVPNRDDRVHRSAQLSPDGRYVAVVSFYTGDDAAARDAALYQLSVASVASIVTAAPDWVDLVGFPQAALAGDVGGPGSSIVWADSGTVFVEMSDGVHAVDVTPAG